MTYDVDYFIDKFSKIPERKWCKGAYTDGGKHCALGHCGERVDAGFGISPEAAELRRHFMAIGKSVSLVNDCTKRFHGFAGRTPKQRVLAALCFIKGFDRED